MVETSTINNGYIGAPASGVAVTKVREHHVDTQLGSSKEGLRAKLAKLFKNIGTFINSLPLYPTTCKRCGSLLKETEQVHMLSGSWWGVDAYVFECQACGHARIETVDWFE